MSQISRMLAVTLLAGVLGGCGLSPALPTATERAAQALDLDMEAAPAEELVVPSVAQHPVQPWETNSRAELHVGPADNLAAIKDLITHARHSLYIEVFNFADDSYGQQIAPLVIDAARRGVKVRFLCDYVGSRFVGGKRLGEAMAAAGGEFRMWRPRFIRQSDKRRGINITHRKAYLADGDRGITGGVNLHAPFDTTTHDLLVDFRGAEAVQLHTEFERDWVMAKGQPFEVKPLPQGVSYGSVRARTYVTSPPEGRFEAQAAIYEAIEQAQRTINIEQQYLWDQGLMDRLVAAAARGVHIRVIVPGRHTDSFKSLHTVALNQILRMGGEARLYQDEVGAHVHTKYFGVDDRLALFGSVNGDTRALMDNQELDVGTTDPGLVQSLKTRLFEHDWQNASVAYYFNDSPFFRGPFTRLWQILNYYM